MDYDYYRNIKSFYMAILGMALFLYSYYRYYNIFKLIPRELKYSNMVLIIGCAFGAIHYYLAMYRIKDFIGIAAICYYDLLLAALVIGGGLALKGGYNYKELVENTKRKKALKTCLFWYIVICSTLIIMRFIAGE